jgi:hypothetical protein
MAGDWIKFEHATPDKPEVVAMADKLGIDQDCVVGKLLRLWIWADQNSADGNALSVTFAFLDRYTHCEGFGAALAFVGWIDADGDGIRLPNFDRHNGETAKKRALGRNRAAKARNAPSVTTALPEKRRELRINKESGSILPIDRQHAVEMVGAADIPAEFIADIYNDKSATAFVDGNGNAISDWSRYVVNRWKRHGKPNGANGKAKAKAETPWSIKARIEEISQQLENATSREDFYDVTGCRLDSDRMNDKGIAHVKKLKEQRASLRKDLAGV